MSPLLVSGQVAWVGRRLLVAVGFIEGSWPFERWTAKRAPSCAPTGEVMGGGESEVQKEERRPGGGGKSWGTEKE